MLDDGVIADVTSEWRMGIPVGLGSGIYPALVEDERRIGSEHALSYVLTFALRDTRWPRSGDLKVPSDFVGHHLQIGLICPIL